MVFNFRTADCMGMVFWHVTPCAVLDRPNIGLLYTILSLSLSFSYPSMSLLPLFGSWSSLSRLYNHTQTPHSVEHFWMSDHRDAESSTSQHTTLTTERYPGTCGFEPTIPVIERPQTSARKQRGHWPRLLTQNFLTFGSQSQPSTPVSSSQKTEAERYSKRSVTLYVTSPSTAVLMVLSRLSSDLVKIEYFALGLTVHSCSGNSCSGR